jgi:hypothetical protein
MPYHISRSLVASYITFPPEGPLNYTAKANEIRDSKDVFTVRLLPPEVRPGKHITGKIASAPSFTAIGPV